MEGRQSTEIKVWVNGSFDVLHRGHIELIQFASKFGVLRIGIDTDERIKEFKGSNRPFNSFEDREYFMSKIKGVNSVVGFGTREELEGQIKEWNPDILVVGSEYETKEVIGGRFAKQVIFFPKVGEFSTTKILRDR